MVMFSDCGTSGSSNPDSGPNSPPIGAPAGSRGSPTAAAPIREEVEEAYGQQGSIGDLSLFSSPSMPNISLGRPHVTSTTTVSHNHSMYICMCPVNILVS